MTARSIITADQASSCYFRTSVPHPYRKALVQITERCDLHCAHCFVSATKSGIDISLGDLREQVIPQLSQARVVRVTLTGGEPFAHPGLLSIVRSFTEADIGVGICTNATAVTDAEIDALAELGVHCNVSLDGFSEHSHGRFRGDRGSFYTTVDTVRRLASAGVLQGLLCTPNNLAEDEEYRQLCEFARAQGAGYVLMNPLSRMGRGAKSQTRLAKAEQRMTRIHELTAPCADDQLETVHIRFPNTDKPLAGCEAGTIIYVFARGEVTVCPYLVFAADTPHSQHQRDEFIVGNILTDPDIADRLDAYRLHDRYRVGENPTCQSCGIASECGKGCPAAVIANGGRIGDVDAEVCPITSTERLLPVTST